MRFWLALTGVLIFAAGAAVGFAASRGLRPGATAVAPPISQAFLEAYLLSSENLYREIQLTEAQRQRVNALLDQHYREVSRLRDELSKVVAEVYIDFEALLTADQLQLFHKIQDTYTKREVQAKVRHEILSLSDDINLSPEQEAKAYLILYDAELARREVFKSCKEKEKAGENVSRDQMRALMAEISARRDTALEEVFSPEQWGAYRERKERWKLWEERRREKERGGKGRES